MARFVLDAKGMESNGAALALAAANALRGSHREIAAQTLRQLAAAHARSYEALALRPVAIRQNG